MKTLSPREYFFVEDIANIGEVKVGSVSFSDYDELGYYSHLKIFDKATVPVFKIISTNGELFLQSGFIDHENNFFGCPITIFYFTIDTINHNVLTDSFETVIKVFNKDSKEYVLKRICGQDGDSLKDSFNNLVAILNLINIYIDRGKDIGEAFFDNIKRRNLYYQSRNEIIAELVNNLFIQFFEAGIYVPQKDNEFYRDVEIGNLPANKYLLRILESYFLDNYKNVLKREKKLIIALEAERWALPSFPRRMIENTQGWEMILKDNLKMDLAQIFDIAEYKLARLFEI